MIQHCAAQLRRCTRQIEVMCNVPVLMQNDTIQMIIWLITHKVTVCVTMTLTTAVLKYLPNGTTASEYVTV